MSTRNDVPAPPPQAPRRRWIAPEVKSLPRLTDLTLQTGIPGNGETSSGSTVIA
jgi:hypothetical protein